jgi:hypothetical protein
MRTSPYRLSRKLDFRVTEFYEVRCSYLHYRAPARSPLVGAEVGEYAAVARGGQGV